MHVLLLVPLLFAADPLAAKKPGCQAADAACTTSTGAAGTCVAEITDLARVGPPRWQQRLTCRTAEDALFRCSAAGAECRTLERAKLARKPTLGLKMRNEDSADPPVETAGTCREVEARSAGGFPASTVSGLACAPLTMNTGGGATLTKNREKKNRHEDRDPESDATGLVVRVILGTGGLIAVFFIGRSFFARSPG